MSTQYTEASSKKFSPLLMVGLILAIAALAGYFVGADQGKQVGRAEVCRSADSLLSELGKDPQLAFADKKALYALKVKSMPQCPVDRSRL